MVWLFAYPNMHFFSFSKQIYQTTNIMGGAANASILALYASQHTLPARTHTKVRKSMCLIRVRAIPTTSNTSHLHCINFYHSRISKVQSKSTPSMHAKKMSDPENHHICKPQQQSLSTPLFGLHHRLFDYAKKKKRKRKRKAQ